MVLSCIDTIVAILSDSRDTGAGCCFSGSLLAHHGIKSFFDIITDKCVLKMEHSADAQMFLSEVTRNV